MSVYVKAYAKINISLNVLSRAENYHSLDTVVTTVNKYDFITAKKRKDGKILITFTGKYGSNNILQEETNAYKAAKLLIDKYGLNGADITVERNIPTGSGMGGSSCDIAGTLKAIKKLYGLSCDLKPFADMLGSDSKYLLNGGYARLTGRGEIIEKLDSKLKLYFVVIYANKGVETKNCFRAYDELKNQKQVLANNDELISGLQTGDIEKVYKNTKNALTESAITLSEEVKENINILKTLSPSAVSMSGSGSTVFAVYDSYEFASWAEDKLKKEYNKNVEMLFSFNPLKPTIFDKMFNISTQEE